jgi:hypothetical protein
MRLYTKGKLIETEDIGIGIQRGVFEGYSLSQMLFCISLIPLTEQLNKLNKLNTEYEEQATKTNVSHFLYMDDLKVRGKTEEEIQNLMQTESSVMTSICNSDLINVQSLYSRKQTWLTNKI